MYFVKGLMAQTPLPKIDQSFRDYCSWEVLVSVILIGGGDDNLCKMINNLFEKN